MTGTKRPTQEKKSKKSVKKPKEGTEGSRNGDEKLREICLIRSP